MQVTQTAMTQLQSIAASFYAQIDTLNGLNPSHGRHRRRLATQALQQVAGLLDTTDGNTYVFGGAGQHQPAGARAGQDPELRLLHPDQRGGRRPVRQRRRRRPRPRRWRSPLPTPPAPRRSPPTCRSLLPPCRRSARWCRPAPGQTQCRSACWPAPTPYVASTGSSTTGSYMRDLMRALATLGSLSSSQVSASGFQGLVQTPTPAWAAWSPRWREDTGVLGNHRRR